MYINVYVSKYGLMVLKVLFSFVLRTDSKLQVF